MRRQDIYDAARQAALEVPFYGWLYEKRGLSRDNVPVFSKPDIWSYEDQTGKSYYASARVPDQPILAYTSGTTSRVFPFPVADVSGRGCHHTLDGLAAALSAYLGEKPVICLIHDLVDSIRCLYEQSAEVEFRFIGGSGPIEERLRKAQELGANAIMDMRGISIKEIMDSNQKLTDYGIRILAGVFFDRNALDFVGAQGIPRVFFYGSVDSAVCHAGCPDLREGVFHIRSVTSCHEVLGDDGAVKSDGEGLYVTTAPELAFPLIRYTNGDRVQLQPVKCTCGFEGSNLVFLGRKEHVKLGAYGPPINYMDVLRYYSNQTENLRVVMLYAHLTEDTGAQRFYVFLERDVDAPHPVADGWKDVMTAGAGDYDPNFAECVKVLALPRGILMTDMTGNKQRVFVDLIRGETVPLGKQLSELVQAYTGEKVA